MSTILVTGSEGFIGKLLVQALLEADHSVIMMDKKLGADVADPGSFPTFGDNPEFVIHLAANTSSKWAEDHPLNDFMDNAKGTITTLEYARKVGAKFIYPSTLKVIPNIQHQRGPYGLSKYLGELLCQEWIVTFKMPIIINRLGNLYGVGKDGEGKHFWVNAFIDKHLKDEYIDVYGDGTAARDMLYVTDVIRLLMDEVNHFNLYYRNGSSAPLEAGGGPSNVLSVNDLLRRLGHTKVHHHPALAGDKDLLVTDNSAVSSINDWYPQIGIEEGIKLIKESYAT